MNLCDFSCCLHVVFGNDDVTYFGWKDKNIRVFNKPLLLVPRITNHLSSFEYGILNIFHAITYCVVCHSYCSVTAQQVWRERMSKKSRSIRLSRLLEFSQSENRKDNRKTFEGASMEPTNWGVIVTGKK